MKPLYLCPICNKKLLRGIASDVTVGYSPAIEMRSMECEYHHVRQVIDKNQTILFSVEVSLGLIEIRDMKSSMGISYDAEIHDNLTITNYHQENLPEHSRAPHATISRLPSSRYQPGNSILLTLLPPQQQINANTIVFDSLFELDFPNLTQAISRARTLFFFA